MYLCGTHDFEKCMFRNGVTFFCEMTSTPVWNEHTTVITTAPARAGSLRAVTRSRKPRNMAPFHKKILRQIVDVTKCYKIWDTITICRKSFVKRDHEHRFFHVIKSHWYFIFMKRIRNCRLQIWKYSFIICNLTRTTSFCDLSWKFTCFLIPILSSFISTLAKKNILEFNTNNDRPTCSSCT